MVTDTKTVKGTCTVTGTYTVRDTCTMISTHVMKRYKADGVADFPRNKK